MGNFRRSNFELGFYEAKGTTPRELGEFKKPSITFHQSIAQVHPIEPKIPYTNENGEEIYD